MQLSGAAGDVAFAVAHRSAGHHNGAADVTLAVERWFVDGMPPSLSALLVTSDLQGRAANGGALLGEALAAAMGRHLLERGIPRERVGVLLAGDLFAEADVTRRGGVGDVRCVWRAFGAHAAFVVGVAGNHDAFGAAGDADAARAFAADPTLTLLDAGTPGLPAQVERHGLRIAGVSGIVGAVGRNWRKGADHFLDAVAAAIATEPDVLLLHQNPSLPGVRRDEQTRLTQLLAAAGRGLVVFGHAFCPRPTTTLGRWQLLATEGRAFWLEPRPHA
jgi:Icc protein